jgi:DNA-directed RNA polymerase specialized sigma24 family protein
LQTGSKELKEEDMLISRSTARKNCQLGLYANASDFADIFIRDMEHLYYLATLLLGDLQKAECCFQAAFDSCFGGPVISSPWASTWTRRSIIKTAISMLSPRSARQSESQSPIEHQIAPSYSALPLQTVQRLPAFDRFVFVLSVLEKYSKRDCCLLLNCSPTDIVAAQIRVFECLADTGADDGTDSSLNVVTGMGSMGERSRAA